MPTDPTRGEEGCPPTPRRRRRRRRLLRVVLQGERRRDGDGDGGRVRSGRGCGDRPRVGVDVSRRSGDVDRHHGRRRPRARDDRGGDDSSSRLADSHRLAPTRRRFGARATVRVHGDVRFAFRPSTTREVPARILVDGAAFLSARAPATFTHEYFHPLGGFGAGSKNRRRRRSRPARRRFSAEQPRRSRDSPSAPPLLATGLVPDAVAGTSNDAVARVAGAHVLAVSFTSHREMDALRASRGNAASSAATSRRATRTNRRSRLPPRRASRARPRASPKPRFGSRHV